MAKRSPIAGYNHNVRYRGLIFHVQTEDSGQQSPHLFTHMFYGGVIISTRKLVYDAGAAEDAIKGLMQSQHKIVLRDLKRGMFDDKIDQYLVGTEGLLPRGSSGAEDGERPAAASASPIPEPMTPEPDLPRASEPALQVRMSEPEITLTRPETDHDITPEMLEPGDELPSHPVIARAATPPPIPVQAQPATARTKTAERKSAPSKVRSSLPPPPPSPDELDPPTINDLRDDGIAAAFAAANATVRTEVPQHSAPDIQIRLELELDDSDAIELPRARPGRDTDIEMPSDTRTSTYSDGVPGQIGASSSGRSGDSIPPLPPPPLPSPPLPPQPERKTGDRGNAVGAATLPPARPIARPPTRQAISPPAAMSRPVTSDDSRTRGDSDAVDVNALAPGSVDLSPGASERPGQYAQYKRVSQRIDVVKGDRERSGATAIPAGLARPGRPSSTPASMPAHPPGSGGIPQRITREPSPHTYGQNPPPHTAPPSHAQTQPIHSPPAARPVSASPEFASRPLERPRTPTPARVSAPSPTPNRAPSSSSGGVVMTRPAVIVGAPAKPAQPKVRKAREEEGRGFGQGLISEKSLDEVILAYLSEDADDK